MKTKLRKTYNLILRIFIVLMTFAFLYDQVFHSNDIKLIIDFFPKVVNHAYFYPTIVLLSVLLFLNFLIESIKWRYFIGKLEKVSLANAFKAILTGISISMFMPNRTGDYLGRIFILKKANRIRAILATITGSMSQLITTIIFGSTALIFAYPMIIDIGQNLYLWLYIGLIAVVILANFIIIFSYLNFGVVSTIIKRISGRGYKRIKKYASVFALYSSKDLSFMLVMSILRYLVFSFQYVLLLWIFQVNIDYFHAMMLIALVYLGMTIIPTIALTELGVRGSVSVFIFSYYFNLYGDIPSNMELAVVSSSTALWIFNLIIPALIGAFFVFNLKFFRKTNGNGKLD